MEQGKRARQLCAEPMLTPTTTTFFVDRWTFWSDLGSTRILRWMRLVVDYKVSSVAISQPIGTHDTRERARTHCTLLP